MSKTLDKTFYKKLCEYVQIGEWIMKRLQERIAELENENEALCEQCKYLEAQIDELIEKGGETDEN